jgi:hypothetical protein
VALPPLHRPSYTIPVIPFSLTPFLPSFGRLFPIFPRWQDGKQESVPGAAGRFPNAPRPLIVSGGPTCSRVTYVKCQPGTECKGPISRHPNAIHLFIILQKLFPKNFKMIMRADFATITSPTPQAFQADFCFHLSRTPFLFFPFSNSVLLCPYFSHASRSSFKCHYHIILQEASQGTVRTCGQQKAHLCLKGVKRSRLRETRAASRESSQRDLQNCGDRMIFYE